MESHARRSARSPATMNGDDEAGRDLHLKALGHLTLECR
jgi:hypothetical protein